MQEQGHQERQVIAVIHKGGKQQIHVSLARFRGRTFGDIRLHVLNPEGNLIPTRKGCTIDASQLEELAEAVEKLRAASYSTAHPRL